MSEQPAAPLEYIYRYRPVEAVLNKYQELEKQEIYFSTTGELNDPMEGFKDLFWSGDLVVWRALLRHYVFCLLDMTYHAFIMGPEFDPKYLETVALSTPDSLPDAPIKQIYERISGEFVADEATKAFLAEVVDRAEPVRRWELMLYLRTLHPFLITRIYEDLHQRGLWPNFAPLPTDKLEGMRNHAVIVFQNAKKVRDRKDGLRFAESLFAASEATYAQIQLLNEARITDRDQRRGIIFLSGNFPEAYLNALGGVVHSEWYVSCFTARPDNHSMWSTYAAGHRGVCLMFKVKPNTVGTPSLAINRLVGIGSSHSGKDTYTRNFVPQEVRQVKYSKEYPAIDFFRSLGRIRQVDMNRFWYLDTDGTVSQCRQAVYDDEGAWRDAYWHTFSESALYKTPEWAHEEEYRIVAHSFFDMSKPSERTLQYQFADLAGIVFGAKTATGDKLKIIEIIRRKCQEAGRTDFKFFEVRYAPDTSFQVHELTLLSIETLNTPINPSKQA